MKRPVGSRVGLGLLLLGFTLQSVALIVLEPNHDHEHHSAVYEVGEVRVSLHGHDGDYHHKGARLEVGEKSSQPACALCARIGKSPALLIKDVALVAAIDPRSSLVPEAAFVRARLGKEPCQPRAPPRV